MGLHREFRSFILGKRIDLPQGIFELENGGGLFGRVNTFRVQSDVLTTLSLPSTRISEQGSQGYMGL